MRIRIRREASAGRLPFFLPLLVWAFAAPLGATLTVTSLVPNAVSPQAVGTRVVWTAAANSTEPGQLDYRFRVRPQGGVFRVVRDYHPLPLLEWAPTESEGTFEIEVTARNRDAAEQGAGSALFTLTPRATSNAVVTPTGHPLVALYSTPACPVGSRIRALFRTGAEAFSATRFLDCAAGLSRNFLIAGLRASTNYIVLHEIQTAGSSTYSTPLVFASGALPATLPFATSTLIDPPEAPACWSKPLLLHANVAFGPNATTMPVATDISGRVVWYASRFAQDEQRGTTLFRPLAGGNMLASMNDPNSELVSQQILRESNLAGNTVRETNVTRISEQLAAMGQDPITSIHHDIIQTPNGRVIALASAERNLTDVQGPGETAVIGDMLIELDEDLQVSWAWNSFDHLDLYRLATLGETCVDGQGGCPPVIADIANDWTHSNSVSYTPDGNLLLSARHQDQVYKIDYQNGAGSGAVLWTLGEGGDFTPLSNDPSPWFSHQHDAEFDLPGWPLLTVYDNGNMRRASDSSAHSRGQVYLIDEPRRLAYLAINADLGVYAFALGSAQTLCNGGFHFDSGVIQPDLEAQSTEVGPDGAIRQVLETPQPAYRTFRMRSMYEQ